MTTGLRRDFLLKLADTGITSVLWATGKRWPYRSFDTPGLDGWELR